MIILKYELASNSGYVVSNSPTITVVAQRAGVSISTVSRALNNDSRISSKTVERVKSVAEDLGYRPNPYVSILMSHLRTCKPAPYHSTLVFLDLFRDREAWKSREIHRKWFWGAEKRASELGYLVERIWAFSPQMNKARLTKMLQSRGITGVIIPPDRVIGPSESALVPEQRASGRFKDPHVIYLTPEIPLDLSRFSVITLGAQYHEPDLPFCCNDPFSSMRLACLRLASLGYRRIGLVAPRHIEAVVDFRFGGAFLASQMLETETRSVIPVCYTEDKSEFEKWMATNKPDCVVALNTRGQVYDWIRGMKINIPEQLGYAVLNWDASQPDFSGIDQQHEGVGAAAVDFLVSQITRNLRGVPISVSGIIIEGSWVDGKTTRPQRLSSD